MAELPSASDERLAAALRGFGPIGCVAILLILAGSVLVMPLGAVLVLLWAWRSRTPWRDLGLARPRHWGLTIASGVLSGAAFKLLMKAVVMPLSERIRSITRFTILRETAPRFPLRF